VSPRSKEFMASAREHIEAARVALASGFFATAVSAAYYGALYAARAALSEEERYAKTHNGVWRLFSELFVSTNRFDRAPYEEARSIQPDREGADYDAQRFAEDEASDIVRRAEGFVEAVASMFEA
jgi:uncharacterized protein (UPF0332 family)